MGCDTSNDSLDLCKCLLADGVHMSAKKKPMTEDEIWAAYHAAVKPIEITYYAALEPLEEARDKALKALNAKKKKLTNQERLQAAWDEYKAVEEPAWKIYNQARKPTLDKFQTIKRAIQEEEDDEEDEE